MRSQYETQIVLIFEVSYIEAVRLPVISDGESMC